MTSSPASPDDLIAALVEVVARGASPEAIVWLREALVSDQTRFPASFAAAGRRIGRARIGEAAAAKLAVLGLPWAAASGADECGRGALVLAALEARDAGEHVPMIRDLLRRGELRERQAVLRVLAGTPQPARFAELAIDAHRSNAQSVFESLALDNAYPARYFADPPYFQMVLKAIFVGAPLARVVGLAERTTDELVRMVQAYASERRAAGRTVPTDVDLIRSHL